MEQLQTFRRQHSPGAATHTPQLARATSEAGGGAVADPGARPRPAASGNFRAKPVPRPCPANVRSAGRPGAGNPGPPPRPRGGRRAGGVREHARTQRARPADPGPPEPHLSAPAHRAPRHDPLRAGLPAPALTVKLQRPEVPPPSGVTRQSAAPGGGSGSPAWASLWGLLSRCLGGNCGSRRFPPHPAAVLGPQAATPLSFICSLAACVPGTVLDSGAPRWGEPGYRKRSWSLAPCSLQSQAEVATLGGGRRLNQ